MENVIRRIQCSSVLYKNCCPPALMHNKWIGVGIFCRHPPNVKALLIPKVSVAHFGGDATAAVIQPNFHKHLSEFGEQMWVLCGMRSQPDPPPKIRRGGDDLTDIPQSSSCLAPDARECKRETLLSLCSLFGHFFTAGHHYRVLLKPSEKA